MAFFRSEKLFRRHLSRFRSESLAKKYDFRFVEENPAITCESPSFSGTGPEFTLLFPPPNVTGKLHIGHAMTAVIQDSLVKYRRMRGDRVVVEKDLLKKNNTKRADLSKQQFLHHCDKWKNCREAEMKTQLQRMGLSLDWNRLYYTMDERFSRAVVQAFCLLYNAELIYRKVRPINWCPTLGTGISDQEVDSLTVTKRTTFTSPDGHSTTLGVLHGIRYRIDGCEASVTVMTTRPETILADVALAVHPEDHRYSALIGLRAIHPLDGRRFLPIIADESVLPGMGSGVVKITPAHSFADWEIAQRHRLDSTIQCIDENGRICGSFHDFVGLHRFVARDKIIDHLHQLGMYMGARDHPSGLVPLCGRTGDLLEPLLRDQWFLDCDQMAVEAQQAVTDGQLRLVPDHFHSHWTSWCLSGTHWCLSRQLDWGHRIPAYFHRGQWKAARNESEARQLFSAGPNDSVVQDSDVLDTWFSSAIIPLVIAGWPDRPLQQIPLNLLETGHDILGIWVTRMVMLSKRLSGKLPYTTVVLHGMIRDEQGRKMSKSVGNVIDPLDVIQGQDGKRPYGADCLRFALLSSNISAIDINLDVFARAKEGSRFCDKLWNLVRYSETVWKKMEQSEDWNKSQDPASCKLNSGNAVDSWLLSRMDHMISSIEESIDSFQLNLALSNVHNFVRNDVCNVYLESTKMALWNSDFSRLREIGAILHVVLESTFRCLSLFLPFISSYLYRELYGKNVFEQAFPKSGRHGNSQLDEKMHLALNIVKSIRSLSSELESCEEFDTKVGFSGILHSNAADISDFYEVIAQLCRLKIRTQVPLNANVCPGHFPAPIHGSDQKLSLSIEGISNDVITDRLQRELNQSIKRKRTFELKAGIYTGYMQQEGHSREKLKKYDKMIRQSERTAAAAASNIGRLQILLSSFETVPIRSVTKSE